MKTKIVFIGNSIVNGFPLSRGRSFPGLVRAAVKAGEASFHADVINKGANGETTAQILDRFEHDVLDHEPAVVLIMTGTNDFIYREAGTASCMVNLKEMGRMAEEHGIHPVYMTPLPVEAEKAERMWMNGLGIDYDQVNQEIQMFSEMIRDSGDLYIDSWEAWTAFAEGTAELADLPLQEQNVLPASSGDAYLDGVHPTPEGYRFLAGIVLAWLEEHAEELGLR